MLWLSPLIFVPWNHNEKAFKSLLWMIQPSADDLANVICHILQGVSISRA